MERQALNPSLRRLRQSTVKLKAYLVTVSPSLLATENYVTMAIAR